jgi:hypothetical protein
MLLYIVRKNKSQMTRSQKMVGAVTFCNIAKFSSIGKKLNGKSFDIEILRIITNY